MANYCKKCFGKFNCDECVERQRDADAFASSFNLGSLTVIPYEEWRALPESAGIYFAFGADNEVAYIGQTKDLYHRWVDNFRRLYNCGIVSIGFILITQDVLWRLCAERALIKVFRPTLDGVVKVKGPKLQTRARSGERKALQAAARLRVGLTVRE